MGRYLRKPMLWEWGALALVAGIFVWWLVTGAALARTLVFVATAGYFILRLVLRNLR